MAGTVGRTRRDTRRSSRRRLAVATAVFGVALIAATAAFAGSAGKLDRSFGHDGIAVIRDIDHSARAVAVGAHNRVVAVAGANRAFAITRTLPNGDVDRGFGNRGVVTVRFGSNDARPTAVVITRFGGIIVAGSICSDNQTCHVGLVRLHEGGDLNRNFGDNGKMEINFPRKYVRGPSLALGRGGRIVIADSNADSYNSAEWDIALAALHSNGSLDPQFGNGGKAIRSFAPAGDHCDRHRGFIEGMALDHRGRIVVAGYCSEGPRTAVARFKQNGARDPSFSENGVVDRKLGMFNVAALAIDHQNRIDVVGDRGPYFAVARLRTDGGLDRSFSKDGKAKGSWSKRSPRRGGDVRSAVIDSRGRIIVGGSHSFGMAFARFKPDGHLDRRFGHRGRRVVKDPNGNFHLDLTGGVKVDPRDRIIGAGAQRRAHRAATHLALVRLLGR